MKATLCIMAKDEAEKIDRALHSALPLFSDVALLLDTSTTDATLDVVEHFCRVHGKKLHLEASAWVNYGHNRNRLLELGRKTGAEWLILLDADNFFAFDGRIEQFKFSKDVDAYDVERHHGAIRYHVPHLLRASRPFFFDLPTHEGLYCREEFKLARADLVMVIDEEDQQKGTQHYLNDAALLLQFLRDNPNHARATFYLAQSFRSAGDGKHAIFWYAQRAGLGGWEEEVYISYLEIAKAMERLRMPVQEVAGAYFAAFVYRPARAEALWHCIRYLRAVGRAVGPLEALLPTAPPPADILFLEPMCYNESVPHLERRSDDDEK